MLIDLYYGYNNPCQPCQMTGRDFKGEPGFVEVSN